MKTDKDNIRPGSYWEHKDPLATILAGVSGKARRQMITDYWNAGAIDDLDEALLQDELDPKERESLGQIHPFFMGGEYLPELLAGEVAIVRIELESTTHDVIELRARPMPDGKIKLRWVDEYGGEFKHEGQPDTIDRPFSFDELKEFICATNPGSDHNLPLAFNIGNCLEGDAAQADGLRYFTRLESEFYPELSGWMEQVVDEWIREKYEEEGVENDH